MGYLNKVWSISVPGSRAIRRGRLTVSPCNLETICASSEFVFHGSNCSIPTTSVKNQANNRHRITATAAHNTENHRATGYRDLTKRGDFPPPVVVCSSVTALSQQTRNVDGSLRLQGAVPTGPVLLVDDMVDSRWTLTVAAYLLTTQGSGPVYPLALTSTANTDE